MNSISITTFRLQETLFFSVRLCSTDFMITVTMGSFHRVKVFPLEQITDEVGNYIYTGGAEARDIKGETSESAQTMSAL